MTQIIHNKCQEALLKLPEHSVDSIITDTPYEYKGGFMSQSWDNTGVAFDPETWRRAMRVAKPGAWLLAFGGRRTWHRMVCAIEEGGFEIADTLMWLYTTGNVTSKTTTLKAAWEPICLARAPIKGSIRANRERHGTGHLEIDTHRLPYLDAADLAVTRAKNPGTDATFTSGVYGTGRPQQLVNAEGRHPANVLIDQAVADLLGRDQRFFKVAKASRRERDTGLDAGANRYGIVRNPHTCVKPIDLMEWLCGLVTPARGTVLDFFGGSMSTGVAAVNVGLDFIGIEQDELYCQTGQLRVDHAEACR